MTGDGHQTLQDVTRDVWGDPIAAARRATEAILRMLDGTWTERDAAEVGELRRRRADSSLLLAVTEAALESERETARRRLNEILGSLQDRTWADEIAQRIALFSSLGIVSLGEATLAVLEAALSLGGHSAVLFTDRRAVARGLTYLGLPIEMAPPEQAGAVLLPAVASMGNRHWTSTRAADVALRTGLRGGEVVVVAHPLAELNPFNRASFRPSPEVVDMKV